MRTHFLLYGGTFDPFHNGHLAAVATAHFQLGVFETHVIPTPRNPDRVGDHHFTDSERVHMIKESVRGLRQVYCVTKDLENGNTRTLETVTRYLNHGHDASLLIGADLLPFLPTWYGAKDLLTSLHTLALIPRPTNPHLDLRFLKLIAPHLETVTVQMPAMAISSSSIRRRIADPDGYPIDGLVPSQIQHKVLRQPLRIFS